MSALRVLNFSSFVFSGAHRNRSFGCLFYFVFLFSPSLERCVNFLGSRFSSPGCWPGLVLLHEIGNELKKNNAEFGVSGSSSFMHLFIGSGWLRRASVHVQGEYDNMSLAGPFFVDTSHDDHFFPWISVMNSFLGKTAELNQPFRVCEVHFLSVPDTFFPYFSSLSILGTNRWRTTSTVDDHLHPSSLPLRWRTGPG